MDDLWKIYNDSIVPFENTDDDYHDRAASYYDMWADLGDHLTDFGRWLWDFGRGVWDAAVDLVDGIVTLALWISPQARIQQFFGILPEEMDEKIKGMDAGIVQLIKDPINTLGAIGQGIADTVDEEGPVYAISYVLTDVLIEIALEKGLGKVMEAGNKLDDVAKHADDVAKHADDIPANQLDELEAFYNDIFDSQREVFPEYEEYLDDLKRLQEDGIPVGEGGLKLELTQSQIDEIVNTPKFSRPDPSSYLSQEYINKHLAQFDDGASIIMTKEQYINYVKGSEYIGIPSDGTQFVMPKNYCDNIATIANGDISVYEQSLGFDIGHFEDGGGLVRIDIENVDGLNLRMPSGNEAGQIVIGYQAEKQMGSTRSYNRFDS